MGKPELGKSKHSILNKSLQLALTFWSQLTVAQLNDFIQRNKIQPAGTKKADLVSAVDDYFYSK